MSSGQPIRVADKLSSGTPRELPAGDSCTQETERDKLLGEISDQEDIQRCIKALSASGTIHSFGTLQPPLPQEAAVDEGGTAAFASSPATRFVNVRHLGQGAFGVVFLAFDRSLGVDIAIKLLRPSQNSPWSRRRFFDEAKTMARLAHPSITRVFDTGLIDGVPYITSSKANGGSLAGLIVAHPDGLEPRRACNLLLQVADAVHSAHRLGIFHRDIKPGNILLHRQPTEDGGGGSHTREQAILTDFGLAKQIDSPADWQRTDASGFLGTTRYMSPEQASGNLQQFGMASEVFSLGIVLYEILTGAVPFSGTSLEQVRQRIVHSTVARPSSRRPGLPRALDAIVLKCLEKDPENRYPSASHLAQDLTRFLNHEPVAATNPSIWQHTISAGRRHPLATGSLLVACLSVLISCVLVAVAWQHQRQARLQEQTAKTAWMDLCGKIIDDIPMGERPQEAVMLSVLDDTVDNLKQELRSAPDSEIPLQRLSVVHHYQSVLHGRLGDFDAEVLARIESCSILNSLRQHYPDNNTYRFQWIYGRVMLAETLIPRTQFKTDHRQTLLEAGLPTSAAGIALPMSAEIDSLIRDLPDRDDYCDAAASFKHRIASTLWPTDPQAANQLADQAFELSHRLSRRQANQPLYAKPALEALSKQAAWASAAGGHDQAVQYIDRAVQIYENHFQPIETETWVRNIAVPLLSAQLNVLMDGGRYERVLEVSDELERQLDSFETDPYWRAAYSGFRFTLEARRYSACHKLDRDSQRTLFEQRMLESASNPSLSADARQLFLNIARDYAVSSAVLDALAP